MTADLIIKKDIGRQQPKGSTNKTLLPGKKILPKEKKAKGTKRFSGICKKFI